MNRILLFAILLSVTLAHPQSVQSAKLDGRLITFKKTFDGWWDVACDTAPDGTDPRCYVQYVDPYSFPPKLRAVMVDFLYRRTADGSAEPVITFDVEPDLSFARDVQMTLVDREGREQEIPVKTCRRATCVVNGTRASGMLADWSNAKLLRWRIRERSGNMVVREWPLGNMREMVRIIAEQRKVRGLP